MRPEDLPEQRFYLAHFRGRTIVIAGADALTEPVADCVAALTAAGVRVVLTDPAGDRWDGRDRAVVDLWAALSASGSVTVGTADAHAAHAVGAAVAIRLRAHKLVLLDPAAPSTNAGGRPRSFATLAQPDPGDARGGLIAAVLEAGVDGVNVCRPVDLAEELLTYRGAGTLYTRDDYCTVERLGIDDFDQVQRLIEQGVLEGYLKPRSADDLARLVVNGYGAHMGDHHMAGFAALLTEPYAAEAMGEICAVSTISRFAGEGVGGRLVQRIVVDATDRGLRGLFACTVSDSAVRFFGGHGFAEVSQAAVPAAKWEDYDDARRPMVRTLRLDIAQ